MIKTLGLQLIEEERENQIDKWSEEHDLKEHNDGSLADLASYLAATDIEIPMKEWAYDEADKIEKKYTGNRIKILSIAGALIAAEIDRISQKVLTENS